MNFLIDVQLPPRLAPWLEAKGFEARHAMDIAGGLTMPDAALWEIGKNSSEIIISKDWDFYERALLKGSPPQVLHIALGNCSTADLFNYLDERWEIIIDALRAVPDWFRSKLTVLTFLIDFCASKKSVRPPKINNQLSTTPLLTISEYLIVIIQVAGIPDTNKPVSMHFADRLIG